MLEGGLIKTNHIHLYVCGVWDVCMCVSFVTCRLDDADWETTLCSGAVDLSLLSLWPLKEHPKWSSG